MLNYTDHGERQTVILFPVLEHDLEREQCFFAYGLELDVYIVAAQFFEHPKTTFHPVGIALCVHHDHLAVEEFCHLTCLLVFVRVEQDELPDVMLPNVLVVADSKRNCELQGILQLQVDAVPPSTIGDFAIVLVYGLEHLLHLALEVGVVYIQVEVKILV